MANVDPYLHAVLLLHGAKKEITKESILAVIKASGADADEAKAKVLADAVKGVNFDDLLKNVAMAASAAPAAQTAAPAAEAKKEAPKEDEGKKEEQAAEGLASLFG